MQTKHANMVSHPKTTTIKLIFFTNWTANKYNNPKPKDTKKHSWMVSMELKNLSLSCKLELDSNWLRS